MKQPIPVILALAAGALNVFAFAPFGYWLLQIGCTALLLLLVMQAPCTRRAAVLGWLYSFAWTCAGVHWLYISLHDLGGMPAWLTVLAIALLALGLGLLVGAATGGARWLQRRWQSGNTVTLLLVLPALWTLAEWTRSWIFTGFPWLSTGYAHADSPLAGYAPLLGVYGVGWVAAVIAAATANLALVRQSWQSRPTVLLIVVLPIAALLIAGQLLRGIAWTQPYGKPITVRLLQGNVPQAMKFDPSALGSTLGLYDAMITHMPADLIATPETALPVVQQMLPPEYLPRLAAFARNSGSHVLLGMPISDRPADYTNGLIVLDPTDRITSTLPDTIYRYDKHHLVPFGEFIPAGFRWFVDTMNIPLGDQTRGARLQTPFAVKDQWILPNICYEDLFGEEIVAQMRWRGRYGVPMPTMLLNISNIAWFGNTIALPQHLQISQMRTLETGRPMLRATNTGATAIIDARGNIEAQLPYYTQGTLAASVQGYQGTTPFIRYGNSAIVAVTVAMLAVAALPALARRFRARA
ncbi:MAG: apolipoprotein N-acyltransferase [Pseudomonadota bacterium]